MTGQPASVVFLLFTEITPKHIDAEEKIALVCMSMLKAI